MTKILIATPAYGETFYTPYVSSVIRLQRLMARNKWDSIFASIAYADIVESRNFLLTHWYDKTDATHMLFIDADMGYDPKLIADMVGLRKPIVGVIAPRASDRSESPRGPCRQGREGRKRHRPRP